MRNRHALTLMELVVVLMVLAATSGLLIPLFNDSVRNAAAVASERSLLATRDAVARYWADTEHVPLDGVTTAADETERFQIQWLFKNPVTGDATHDFDPATRIGWRGPYISGVTGSATPATLVDAWNRPIEIQDVDPTTEPREVRVVSGGADGTISIPVATPTDALTTTDVGDDLYVVLILH